MTLRHASCRLVLLGSVACLVASLTTLSTLARAESPAEPSTYDPPLAAASDEAERAIARIRVPEGYRVELFAAEPLLANPVAFCIDDQGRFYVAETFRHTTGVTDNRSHMYWLEDDLASRTVEDRVAMYRRHLGDGFAAYEVDHDRVRQLVDTDGDGQADRATVFADRFHDAASGIGSGLIARDGRVWYACIPHLWLLEDGDDDGFAERRSALHSGYGVHVAFIGHDLHGLCFGPDGKLYFSIGDRGLHVETEGRTLDYPDTGAVLRCNPDGSELEVYAFGLRNPQELAFDEYGNLFTGDNNADGGDQARLVQVVEGGDSGWRIGYQYLRSPVRLGPWNEERLWMPEPAREAAYLVPPIANLGSGPSGLTYHPGTGLLPDLHGRFFVCDFRGSSSISGVRTFRLGPRGAGFELLDSDEFAWSILATDVDFGYDGALYISDWTEGWEKPQKGRIYRVVPAELEDAAKSLEVQQLVAAGFSDRPIEELARLLAHADARIRQRAQFGLAERGGPSLAALDKVARNSPDQLARLHAIWGLGQLAGDHAEALTTVRDLLSDADAEVRAQSARVLGDRRYAEAYDALLDRLTDEAPRVQFYAALALGKIGNPAAAPALIELLRRNDEQDPYLRHAAAMGLAWTESVEALLATTADPSVAVRLGSVVALRRLEHPEVARFLADDDPRVVLEAARAIYDVPIADALPQLARLTNGPLTTPPLWHRVLNANLRLGTLAHAEAVADVANRPDVQERLRLEALQLLGAWTRPSNLDLVTGLYRPLEERPVEIARAAAAPILPALLQSSSDRQVEAAATLAGQLAEASAAPLLIDLLSDERRASNVRAAALTALDAISSQSDLDGGATSELTDELIDAVRLAVASDDAGLKSTGLRVLARLDAPSAVKQLATVLEAGNIGEQQQAFDILNTIEGSEADSLLAGWLDRLLASSVPPEIALDLLVAAQGRSSSDVADKIATYEARRSQDDPLAPYREALVGGDAERGRRIFYDKAEASCLRCHKIRGQGGEVGPDLTTIASRENREHLLESLVAPNAKIAKGFETIVAALDDGQVVTGVLRTEDDERLWLMTAEGKPLTVPKASIEERSRGVSAMPERLMEHLSTYELRDLVEFLSQLR